MASSAIDARTSPPTLTYDPLGFPILKVPALGLACHLFPATKVQYEYFLGGTPGVDASGYLEMLDVCPRVSWRFMPPGWPAGLFASGARPEDATQLASWLGNGYRLPTAAEWQRLDAVLDRPAERRTLSDLATSQDFDFHPCARALLEQAAEADRAWTWRAVGMFEDGLLEWVTCPDGRFGLHGLPRSGSITVIHNPQVYLPIRPATNIRHPAFGFRLVRSLGRRNPS